jgi:N-acyl homoserine lactone hydrolase
LEALIDQPGPIELRTVVSADWTAPLSGVLNLKDPKAVQAGLTDRPEPIQINTYVLRHPTQGFFLVDTGVSKPLVADPKAVGVGWLLRHFVRIEKMQVRQDTASIIGSERAPLKGIFMTHLHLDHISGLPDIPKEVPIYRQ